MTEDLTITKFAQRFRLEAAAALVQIIRDETASPQARAAAADKILAYSDGRPGASKQIGVADLESMSPDQRQDLLHALLTKYDTEFPGAFQAQVEDAYVSALQRVQSGRPIRYKRGAPTPKPAHIVQRPITRGNPAPPSVLNKQGDAARTVNGGPRYAGSEVVPNPAQNVGIAVAGATTENAVAMRIATEDGLDSSTSLRNEVDNGPDSSTLLRSNIDSRAADNVIPLPYGLKYENPLLGNNPVPDTTSAAPPTPVNGIYPQVLARSARAPGMAMDVTFRDYNTPWRSRW